jgi:hypothetical protein
MVNIQRGGSPAIDLQDDERAMRWFALGDPARCIEEKERFNDFWREFREQLAFLTSPSEELYGRIDPV